jgi:hypothetical protein
LLNKTVMIKKDDKFHKYVKNEDFLKCARGDILGLEALDSEPEIIYKKIKKDKTLHIDFIMLKKVFYDYSLIVGFNNIGR